jgi:DTW domain
MVFTAVDSSAFILPIPPLVHSTVPMVVRPMIPSVAAATQYRKSLLEAFAAARLTEPTASVLTDEVVEKKQHIHDNEVTFLKQVATLSSSPERLWAACAMAQRCSLEDIPERRRAYDVASMELDRVLSDRFLLGTVKHQFHCRHRLLFGRMPLVCRNCWSYLPICICPPRPHASTLNDDNSSSLSIIQQMPYVLPGDAIFARVPQLPLPVVSSVASSDRPPLPPYNALDMILWTHHKEWGSPSNTGSVLVVALEQLLDRVSSSSAIPFLSGHMLMKGLEEHEAALAHLLQPQRPQEVVLPVVLWASDHSNGDSTTTNAAEATSNRCYVSVEQLFHELRKRSNGTNCKPVMDTKGEKEEMNKIESVQLTTSVRIVLIAVEGTWSQARRMVTKLPATVRALHLSDAELFGWRRTISSAPFSQGDTIAWQRADESSFAGPVSILDPLRKQKTLNRFPEKKAEASVATVAAKVVNTNKVCTMEAAVSALVALQAVRLEEAEYLLSLADQKVMRTVAYQGKMALRNILSDW